MNIMLAKNSEIPKTCHNNMSIKGKPRSGLHRRKPYQQTSDSHLALEYPSPLSGLRVSQRFLRLSFRGKVAFASSADFALFCAHDLCLLSSRGISFKKERLNTVRYTFNIFLEVKDLHQVCIQVWCLGWLLKTSAFWILHRSVF